MSSKNYQNLLHTLCMLSKNEAVWMTFTKMVYDHFLLLLYQMLKRGAEFDFIYTDF